MVLGEAYKVNVKSIHDMPNLALAMETHGRFKTARKIMDWHTTYLRDIEMEHKIGKTSNKST